MNATAKLRRRAGQRVSSALWGLLVMGSGALMIATLSGYDIDMQLIAIIGLGALGAWLLISAAVSGWGRQKQIAQATAPVVEEPAMRPTPEADKPASDATPAPATATPASADDARSADDAKPSADKPTKD